VSGIDRRRFLGAGAAAVVGAAATRLRLGRGRRAGVPQRAPAGSGARAPASTPDALVAAYFTDPVSTQHIGAAYVLAFPADVDVTTLMGEIAPPDAEPATWWSTIDQPGLAKHIRKRSHADFADHDVVDLDGWQLAHTEARLAALWVQTQP
jgi:hypothetical protein